MLQPSAPMKLPPYRGPSLPPTIFTWKPHSAQKSMRKMRIFPGCQLLPTTNTGRARLRLSRKDRRLHAAVSDLTKLREQLQTLNDTKGTKMMRLMSLKARLAATNALYATCMASLSAQPLSVHVPPSDITNTVFIPHSLAPDIRNLRL